MPSGPAKRVNSIKGIAGTNMFVGTLSLLYHTWTLVFVDRERILQTGQEEIVGYIGIVTMNLISLILVWVSWNLISKVGLISSQHAKAIKAGKLWKRLVACFLTFFIIALMILVLSSGNKVHKSVIQNYMAFLLILIAFTIFGIYYVGAFVTEAEKSLVQTTGPLNNAAGIGSDPEMRCD